MLERVNDIKIRYKLWAIIGLMSMGTAALILVSLTSLFNSHVDARKDRTQDILKIVNTTIQPFYEKQQSGELTESQAKQQALTLLSSIRYGDQQSLWIMDQGSQSLLSSPASYNNTTPPTSLQNALKRSASTLATNRYQPVEFEYQGNNSVTHKMIATASTLPHGK